MAFVYMDLNYRNLETRFYGDPVFLKSRYVVGYFTSELEFYVVGGYLISDLAEKKVSMLNGGNPS